MNLVQTIKKQIQHRAHRAARAKIIENGGFRRWRPHLPGGRLHPKTNQKTAGLRCSVVQQAVGVAQWDPRRVVAGTWPKVHPNTQQQSHPNADTAQGRRQEFNFY